MVGRTLPGAVPSAAIVLVALAAGFLTGCDFFASPLPGFLSGVEQTIVVEVGSILGDSDDALTRFDLEVVGVGPSRRLLLKVEPPNADPEGFEYAGRMIVMTPEMVEETRLAPESSIDYLSRPYGFGHDGQLLVGYTIFDLSGVESTQKLTPHGLGGFITVDEGSTHLFSVPGDRFTAFHLEIRSYTLTPWTVLPAVAGQVAVVPDGIALSADPVRAQSGYQLLGLARDGSDLVFLFSQPTQRIVFGVRASLADVLDTGTGTVLAADESDRLFTIEADRPQASADDEGFFLMRRNGWFERYDWGGNLRERVTGDTSFARRYAFDVEGDRFYRYDPQTSTLTRIRGWW